MFHSMLFVSQQQLSESQILVLEWSHDPKQTGIELVGDLRLVKGTC
jgi:hypothetical protein